MKPFAEMTDEEKEVSHKRYFSQHIMRLSSGRFALMTSFSNAIGIQQQAIGTLAELEPLIVVPDLAKIRERQYTPPPRVEMTGAQLSDLDLELDL